MPANRVPEAPYRRYAENMGDGTNAKSVDSFRRVQTQTRLGNVCRTGEGRASRPLTNHQSTAYIRISRLKLDMALKPPKW